MIKYYVVIVCFYIFVSHFSIIGTLKISQRSNDLTVGKETEYDFNKQSQNSEYHEKRPVHSNRILGRNAIVGDKMLIKSYSSIRNISKEKGLSHQLSKREYPKRGFTEELKQEILDLHNLYRGNVTPSAANMAFMEWDEELEHLAQLWADHCKFEHGFPPGSRYSRGGYGQNLYKGSEPSGSLATYLWYEEYKYYDMKTQYCKPKEMCGHYVQLAWAKSNRLGCGITKCDELYIIVCHYHAGTIKDVQMYEVGKPCSLCPKADEALCYNNLCMSSEQCGRNPDLCATATCNLKCHNCGKLDSTKCQCLCADGWDFLDCSIPCADEHEKCHKSPGFPNEESCPTNDNLVETKYCRKMCSQCNPYNEEKTVSHICCDGKICDKGYVLEWENKTCECEKLCPGPKCGAETIKYHFVILILQILIAYIITKLTSY